MRQRISLLFHLKSLNSLVETSLPFRMFGICMFEDTLLRRLLTVVTLTANVMCQINNFAVLTRVNNVSARIERTTYFVEGGVALVAYLWMMRNREKIFSFVPTSLGLLETILVCLMPLWMLVVNILWYPNLKLKTDDLVLAFMNCFGRSFGSTFHLALSAMLLYKLGKKWAELVDECSACVESGQCRCELKSVMMDLSGIQRHVYRERSVLCEADAVLCCIPYCSSALVLAFSCLHCTMMTATSDRVPFLNPNDQWSMILALETCVFFWAASTGGQYIVSASKGFRRRIMKIRHVLLTPLLRDNLRGARWIGGFLGWRSGIGTLSTALTYAILMRSSPEWLKGNIYFA